MRNYLLLVTIVIFSLTACGQTKSKKKLDNRKAGLDYIYHHKTMDEILEIAKKAGKPIFLDIQTKWCTPCKAMMKNVFPDPRVCQYLSMNYITVTVDAEEEGGIEIGKKFGATSYPTLVFLDKKGDLLIKKAGGLNVDQMLSMAKSALSANPVALTKSIARFEAGQMQNDELLPYLEQLAKAQLDCGPALDKWIVTVPQAHLVTNRTYAILSRYRAAIGSKAWDVVLNNYEGFVKLAGKNRMEVTFFGKYLFESYMNNSRKKAGISDLNPAMWKSMEDANIPVVGYVKECFLLVTEYMREPSKQDEYIVRADKLMKAFPDCFSNLLNEAIKCGHMPKIRDYATERIMNFGASPQYKSRAAQLAKSFGFLYAINFKDFKTCLHWYKLAEKWQPGIVEPSRFKTIEGLLGLTKCEKAGEAAPNWTFKRPNGETLSLSDLKGKYVVIDWWASWCGPCIQEIPSITKAYEAFKDKNVEFVSITVDANISSWTKAIAKNGLPWHNVRCTDDKIRDAYGVIGYPTLMLLDKEGKFISFGLRGNGLMNALDLYAK